jgi:hypothetical protein
MRAGESCRRAIGSRWIRPRRRVAPRVIWPSSTRPRLRSRQRAANGCASASASTCSCSGPQAYRRSSAVNRRRGSRAPCDYRARLGGAFSKSFIDDVGFVDLRRSRRHLLWELCRTIRHASPNRWAISRHCRLISSARSRAARRMTAALYTASSPVSLHHQCQHAGRHQSGCPDQIEV